MIDRGDVLGVVLAGGKSRRMGSDKALLEWGGRTFLERLVEVCHRMFGEAVVSGGGGLELPGVRWVADRVEDAGPLGGIHASMLAADRGHLFVVACDMPMVEEPVVERILVQSVSGEITVASAGGRLQPLCGVYPVDLSEDLGLFLAGGKRKVREYLDAVGYRAVEVGELENLNDRTAYRTFQRARKDSREV